MDGTWIEPLTQKSIGNCLVLSITQEDSWMTNIIPYILTKALPLDKVKAQQLKNDVTNILLSMTRYIVESQTSYASVGHSTISFDIF